MFLNEFIILPSKFIPLNEFKVVNNIPEHWSSLEKLFGKSGAYWGCWCIYWRKSAKEFDEMKVEKRKFELKLLSDQYRTGLIAFLGDEPVGWMGIGPKSKLERLVKSRVIKSVDDHSVVSIVCFFVHKSFRKRGVSSALVKAIVKMADKGGEVLECYPIDLKEGEIVDVNGAYVGTRELFAKFGFEKVRDTKSKSAGKPRIIMRYYPK